VYFRDAVGAGTTLLGKFIIPLTQTLGPPFFTLLGAWLTARYGRSVRLKIGDVEAQARTVEEVEKLLDSAKKFQQEKNSADDNGNSE